MNIRHSLTKEHSRTMCTRIVNYVGGDAARFGELMHIFLESDYRLCQRAAWPLSDIALAQPKLVGPYLGKLVKKLGAADQHPAVARNILRILQFYDIPEKHAAPVYDLCLRFIMSASSPTGIRAFAITVAGNIAVKYPELKNELLPILEDMKLRPLLPAIRHRLKKAFESLGAA